MYHSGLFVRAGGQTGVDRAALDVALTLGISCGGWCPKGRMAEDGRIPDEYPLKETDSENSEERTTLNVKSSDATIVIYWDQFDKGTAFTVSECVINGKPIKEIDLSEPYNISSIRDWLTDHQVIDLNIAGPRESHVPGIYAEARKFLERLFNNALQ